MPSRSEEEAKKGRRKDEAITNQTRSHRTDFTLQLRGHIRLSLYSCSGKSSSMKAEYLKKSYRHYSLTTAVGYLSNCIYQDADDALEKAMLCQEEVNSKHFRVFMGINTGIYWFYGYLWVILWVCQIAVHSR